MCVVRVTPVLGTGAASLSLSPRQLAGCSAISETESRAHSGATQAEERLEMQPIYAGMDSDMRADVPWQVGLFH